MVCSWGGNVTQHIIKMLRCYWVDRAISLSWPKLKRDCIVCSNRQLGMRKQTKMICKQCTKPMCVVPHHLIVNVYYMAPSPPPPDSMLGGIHYPPPPLQCWERSDAQTRVQTNIKWGGGGGVKLEQVVMYVHWIQVNGSFPIRKTEFVINCLRATFQFCQFSPHPS